MYELTQEVIVAALRLRGRAQGADIVHILEAGLCLPRSL